MYRIAQKDCQKGQQEIVFKKVKATLHVTSKRFEDTVIIPIKLERDLQTKNDNIIGLP